eukprot:CAMPEP_0172621884 /NCGR_PEP_ID=MMETSP1068-20121228/116211_1 /TAXON_ID=35684 /ORGANISM="Pseudopedinella elastica, Strain CCMP716" /LENGTH=46 /DNA_ID= /DNA_START= /DNA_END= /DNA_ORIENTATION=
MAADQNVATETKKWAFTWLFILPRFSAAGTDFAASARLRTAPREAS